MYIYIFLIILIILLGSQNYKKPLSKGFYVSIIGTLMFFLFAFRAKEIGIDTQVYYSDFSFINATPFFKLSNLRMEIGFVYLVKVLGLFSTNPQILLVVSGLIITGSVSTFIYKYSTNVRVSLLLFVFLMFMFSYMNIMRQAIAISILLLSFRHLLKGNNFTYFIYIIIASTFHIAAIFMIPIIFLAKLKIDFKTIIIILSTIVVMFFIFTPALTLFFKVFPKYSYYLDNIDGNSNYFGALIDFIFYSSIFIAAFIFYDYENQTRFDIIFIWMFILQIFFQMFTMKMTVVNRVGQIYAIFAIVGIPLLISKSKKLYIRQSISLILVVSAVYFITISLLRPEWNGVIPYLPFW